MDSIAWNIGSVVCRVAGALNAEGLIGDSCLTPMQFGYRFSFGFVLVFVVVWLLRPRPR